MIEKICQENKQDVSWKETITKRWNFTTKKEKKRGEMWLQSLKSKEA